MTSPIFKMNSHNYFTCCLFQNCSNRSAPLNKTTCSFKRGSGEQSRVIIVLITNPYPCKKVICFLHLLHIFKCAPENYSGADPRFLESGFICKGVGVCFADFISFFLNIPWKWNDLVNNLVSLRPNYFIFIWYLKTEEWGVGFANEPREPPLDPSLLLSWKQTLWTLIKLLLREQCDLGPYCLQNRQQMREQTAIIVNGSRRVISKLSVQISRIVIVPSETSFKVLREWAHNFLVQK